jgi:glutamate racemase
VIARGPIGIFDSGIGGLTVLKEVEKVLPGEDVIYFGDTARVPYGNKSKATIIKFSTENILFLLRKKVKLVIIACNTSSALALDYLKTIFNLPIIGVIEAGVNKALEVSQKHRIGVIGTRATVESRSYEREILRKSKKAQVYSRSCPLLVPLVEEGILDGRIVDTIIRMYMSELKSHNVDVVILGCTHYPLLKEKIASYMDKSCIVDSAREVALHAKTVLESKNLLNRKRGYGKREFYVTDEPAGFAKLAKLFLKRSISKPRVVNV